jgi:hypothetical protein
MGIAEAYKKNVDAIISEVRMSRGRFYILVEGSSDYRFLRGHFADAVCVKNVAGRDAVVNATRILSGFRKENFVGLVDADFKSVVAGKENMPRLVHVSLADDDRESCIDLEACLLRTEALEKVCLEAFGDRLEEVGGVAAETRRIRAWLRETGTAIGAYRAAVMEHSAVGDRVVSLEWLDECTHEEWNAFAQADSMALDRGALESLIKSRVMPQEKFASLRQTAADYAARLGTGWLLCRGHDMCRLLAMHFNAKHAAIHGRAEVERALRMSFDRRMLAKTPFGQKLFAFCA